MYTNECYPRSERSTPEAEGVAPGSIAKIIDTFAETNQEIHTLMIMRHGKVIADMRWKPYSDYRCNLFSLTKTFTSTAIGIAIGEGKLSLSDKVVSFFPEYADALMDEKMKDMTVEDCLTMCSGYYTNISGSGIWSQMNESWIKAFLELPLSYKPGTHYAYNSGSSHMLSSIVTKATGMNTKTYLTQKLFAPLGIDEVLWDTDHEGNSTGGWGLWLNAEQICRVGQLYLQNGLWEGKQIIPKDWIDTASVRHVYPMEDDWNVGYGYQIWTLSSGEYMGRGAFGQYLVVMPGIDCVAAMTSCTWGEQRKYGALFHERTIINCLKEGIASETQDAFTMSQSELEKKIGALSIYTPTVALRSSFEREINGKSYHMRQEYTNLDHLKEISFDFYGRSMVFNLRDDKGEYSIKCGMGYWEEGVTSMPGKILHHNRELPVMACAGCAEWENDHTLVMHWAFLEMAFVDTVRVEFIGRKLMFFRSVNANSDNTLGGTLKRPMVKGDRIN